MTSTQDHLVGAVDESGAIICAYTLGPKDAAYVAVPPKKTTGSYAKGLLDVFLPAGYPHTVTEDYMPYQIYDSLQAFSSSIAGLLSNRAVLQGIGVGDAASSATGAVLLSVLQESTGRLATILFAHRAGQAIEPECKRYRFLADILNDAALLLDVLSPALPWHPRVLVLCAAGVLRSLCGVAAGAAKASLSAHFARNGNLAELNAKDGSQETVISLVGMLVGSLFVRAVQGRAAVWAWMSALLAVHLWTNYQAVRAVQMRSLNRQRMGLVAAEYARCGRVLRPAEVAARERILTWREPPVRFARTFPASGQITSEQMQAGRDRAFVTSVTADGTRLIFLKSGATTLDALKAYVWALTTGAAFVDSAEFWKALSSAGWNLETGAMETGPAIRLVVS